MFPTVKQQVLGQSQDVLKKAFTGSTLSADAQRIANRRKDFHRKTAHHLCDCLRQVKDHQAGMVFAEDLNLKGLAKGILGKHCLDAGWGEFLDTLKWVAWKRGVYFLKVPASGTSQECPACSASVKKDLFVRIHHCPECGYQTDRDVASSQVIRNFKQTTEES